MFIPTDDTILLYNTTRAGKGLCNVRTLYVSINIDVLWYTCRSVEKNQQIRKKTIKKFVDGEYKVQCISNRKCKIWMKASNHRGVEGRKKVWYQLVADTVSASRNHLPIMRTVMTMILMMLINTMTQWVNWPNKHKEDKEDVNVWHKYDSSTI